MCRSLHPTAGRETVLTFYKIGRVRVSCIPKSAKHLFDFTKCVVAKRMRLRLDKWSCILSSATLTAMR